jgi:hypothetical protein
MLAALAELKRDPSALAPLEVGAYGLALCLVTPRDIADDALIERLGSWRAASMANYRVHAGARGAPGPGPARRADGPAGA